MCTQNTQEKSQKKAKSSSRSCCPWFLGIVLLLGAIGGLLAYDTQRNDGVFEKSATGKFLKDAGALPYVETAWFKSLSSSARGFQWAETNVPIYVNKTCVVLKPYGDFLIDLSIVGLNAAKNGWTVTKEYVVAKTPAVVSFVSTYYTIFIVVFNTKISGLWLFEYNFIFSIRLRTMHQDYRKKLLTDQFPRGKSFLVQVRLFTQIALIF